MERLWRPWRMGYVRDIESRREERCIFCSKPEAGDDRSALILHRGDSAFMIMNLYPYNTGHVMVAPFRHVGALEDLTHAEIGEIMDLTALVISAIKKELGPQGFNLGMNLGKVAGAGFDEHLHMHVVPRWQGDTNFMPVLGDSKVMPENLEDTYDRLLHAIEAEVAAGD
jgi:ATP adenylyltransferase